MPVIDVDKARTVMAIKRSMAAGFAGIDNPLYYLDQTLMLFGDAKNFVGNIVRELTGAGDDHGQTGEFEKFDSCEVDFRLESGCWSTDKRATTVATQPRENWPKTSVETKAVTGRSPKPAAGRVAATKGGSQHMNRIPVSSQGITEVGYHEDADSLGTLELKFSNGGVYEFFNVPTKMYDEFMHAPSRDDYYRANIGKRFPCTRVG